MMVKLRLLVPLIVALAVMASAAQAITYYWDQTPGGAFMLKGDPNNTWGTCVYKPFNPWFVQDAFNWDDANNDPGAALTQTGTVPPEDPIVNQLFRNRTTGLWTDWHVDITGGTINPDSAVVKNNGAPSPLWSVEYTGAQYDVGNNLIGYSGFSATTVPGSQTYVGNQGLLSVYFEYTAGGTATFNQYPTTTAPIPEPASIAGLMMGLVALAGIRRKR